MTKIRKRFGLSEALDKGLSETVHLAEHERMFRTIFVPLDQIEPDPNNPRKLNIVTNDLINGIRKDDPLFSGKQSEYEKLETLAATIKNDGLLNPIIIYKTGAKYKIVAGERRYLASILAGKKEIEARVFEQKPTYLALKVIQWVENTEREDLSLMDRIDNIRDIINAYAQDKEISFDACTGETLSKITGLSTRQSQTYLSVLKSSGIVQEAIKEGCIKNIDKAVVISAIASESVQLLAIDACAKGASLAELKKIASVGMLSEKQDKQETHLKKKSSDKSETSKIKMGTVDNTYVIKEIVESVLKNPRYQIYASFFSDTNWDDVVSATKGFRKMLAVIQEATFAEA